jgi:tRNA threonylcarbamoyladenosine modification (KEOPS) complex  Pcc1 subunit
MTHSVTITIPFATPRDADIILQALTPELAQKMPGSDTRLTVEASSLILAITTDDISSLRAACNSYLRWVQTAMSVKDLV